MSRSLRVLLLILVASLTLSACTQEERPAEGPREARPGASEAATGDFIAGTSIALPPTWSYMVSRQAAETPEGESWLFTVSPFSFNLGTRCDRQTGPLVGSLFKRAEVFLTGSAYVAEFPPSADKYKQTPGQFRLDASTVAQYEGFCVPTYRIDFEQDDFYVSMHVAVHDKARDATVEAALEALNSIR